MHYRKSSGMWAALPPLLAIWVGWPSKPALASVTLGVNGGVGLFNGGIGANPVFGFEALDSLYKPLLTGFYGSYSLLGGATQGGQSLNASLVSFGLEFEYPLSMLVRGLSVGLRIGAGYETVPVNAGGTLASGSAWVFGAAPALAYDYHLSSSWSAGVAAELDYYTAPSFSGVAGTALIAPEVLLRVRYSFGQGDKQEAASPASPTQKTGGISAAGSPAKAKSKSKKTKPTRTPKPSSDQ